MKRLVFDLDETICFTRNGDYKNSIPNESLIRKLKNYKDYGFEIVICTARNMRTYGGNVGQINANTLPVILDWLKKHHIPYDEIIIGKPWCGTEGFYIDDKAIRPNEFIDLSYNEIKKIVGIKNDNN